MVSVPPSPQLQIPPSPPLQTSFTQRIQFPNIIQADLILRTEDGYDFAISKDAILREGGVLARKLTSASQSSYELLVYDVQDTYMVWWTILWQLYGDKKSSKDDLFCSLEHVYRAYTISTQLEMCNIPDKVWEIVDTLTKKKPYEAFHTFFLAHKSDWVVHCEYAAHYTLQHPSYPDFLSPYEIALLQKYRNACADAAVDALVCSITSNSSKNVPCWQSCGRCASDWCINRHQWPLNWALPRHNGPSVAIWFAHYFHDLCERLHRAPSSAVVEDSKLPIQYLLDSSSEVCTTCQTCRAHGLMDLDPFRRVAKRNISAAISKVPLTLGLDMTEDIWEDTPSRYTIST
ncbi:hypothetical protein QCA50_010640 [Cerrena zonata]|uniref:Uncharacterized protein n=1 Tax=Cerrena zonata TaxID=2478898 RepID=A0AAW0GA00_9APHY